MQPLNNSGPYWFLALIFIGATIDCVRGVVRSFKALEHSVYRLFAALTSRVFL